MLTSSLSPSSSHHVFARCVLLALSTSGMRVELELGSHFDEQNPVSAHTMHQDLTESPTTAQTDTNASHQRVALNTLCSVVPVTDLAVPEEFVADLTTSGDKTTVQFMDTKKNEVCLRATYSTLKRTSTLDKLGLLANDGVPFKGVFAGMSATKQILPMFHKFLNNYGVKTMEAWDAAEFGSPNGCIEVQPEYRTGIFPGYIPAYYATMLWFVRKGKTFYQEIYGDAYTYRQNQDECNTLARELSCSGLSELADEIMDDLKKKRCGPNFAQKKFKSLVDAAQKFVKESSAYKEMFIASDGLLNFPIHCHGFIVDLSRALMCS